MRTYLKPVLYLAISVVIAATSFAVFNACQKTLENGDSVDLGESAGPFAVSGEIWNAEKGTCTLRLLVADADDAAIAIMRSSSDPVAVQVNGIPRSTDSFPDTRQVLIVPVVDAGSVLAGTPTAENVDETSPSETEDTSIRETAAFEVNISTGRWDASDQIFIGTEYSVMNTFVIEYRIASAVVLTVLVIMLLYGLSLYLSKKTETYLRPFLAYTSLLAFWLLMINTPNTNLLPHGVFDFIQVCGHFYVAYIPFAICVILVDVAIPRRLSILFRWQGLLLAPLALGTLGFFTSFGAVMIVTLLMCLCFAGYALSVSYWRGSPGTTILLIGFGITMGLKITAFLVDYGLAVDSILFLTMRKTRFLNIPVLLAIMVFLNRRFATNFLKSEQLGALLDKEVEMRTSELERQQNMRLGMMANIFHDLRTPLFVMKNCLDTLGSSSGEKGAVLTVLNDRVAFLSRLIDDLFTASKLEDDDLIFGEEPVDIDETIDGIAEASQLLASQNGITLAVEREDRCITWGDPHYLSRAFENLITNAIRYTPEGGTAQVEVYRRGPDIFAAISNTGKGISPESLVHIFERYYHRNETTPKSPSSGLGLSIAQSIIEKHRGTIAVMNRPGEGCTFLVRLPALDEIGFGEESGRVDIPSESSASQESGCASESSPEQVPKSPPSPLPEQSNV